MTSAATIAMLATPFRPNHRLSPFPANTPKSDADWKLYHISAWAGLFEGIGWEWNTVELVACDDGSSNYDDHQYLIRIPHQDGADWAVLWTDGGSGFDHGELQVTLDGEFDIEAAGFPAGVTGDYHHVTGMVDWAGEWDRYHGDAS